MREYIGHELKLIADGIATKGLMVKEDSIFAYVKGEKETWRIPKAKIGMFAPTDFEPFDYVPFHVLFCENPAINCPGVQFIKEGAGFSQQDMERFMKPCPQCSSECKRGSKGELRTVSGKFLSKMFSGTMYGDYPPEKKGK